MLKFFIIQKKIKVIVYFIVISIILTFILSYFFQSLTDKPIHSDKVRNFSNIKYFFSSVLIAPLMETLFFQAIIIEFINKNYNDKLIYSIYISGFIFGFMHFFNTYNFIYTIHTIIMGSWFAFIYVASKKRLDINPFFMTFISHLLINFIAFLPRIYPNL